MGEKYERFAQETYKTFHDTLKKGVPHGKGSALVVILEQHMDTEFEARANSPASPDYQEPAIAGAYSHVAALVAAGKIVGKDKVALSIEMDTPTLSTVLQTLKDNQNNVPQRYLEWPSVHALAYAQKNGIKIIPTDPLGGHKLGAQLVNPAREDAMRLSIKAIVADKENAKETDVPKVVVHVGGANHLAPLQGYDSDEIVNAKGKLKVDPERNPFKEDYAHTFYFNTTRMSPSEKRGLLDYEKNPDIAYLIYCEAYSTDSDNAKQIDAPGRVSYEDQSNIAARIEQAAAATQKPAAEARPAALPKP